MKKKKRPGAGDAEPKKKGNRKPLLNSEITKRAQAPFLSVYDGQTCIGFLLTRGKAGVEAFNADDRSLGIFPDQKSAADAISKVAS